MSLSDASEHCARFRPSWPSGRGLPPWSGWHRPPEGQAGYEQRPTLLLWCSCVLTHTTCCGRWKMNRLVVGLVLGAALSGLGGRALDASGPLPLRDVARIRNLDIESLHVQRRTLGGRELCDVHLTVVPRARPLLGQAASAAAKDLRAAVEAWLPDEPIQVSVEYMPPDYFDGRARDGIARFRRLKIDLRSNADWDHKLGTDLADPLSLEQAVWWYDCHLFVRQVVVNDDRPLRFLRLDPWRAVRFEAPANVLPRDSRPRDGALPRRAE